MPCRTVADDHVIMFKYPLCTNMFVAPHDVVNKLITKKYLWLSPTIGTIRVKDHFEALVLLLYSHVLILILVNAVY